MKRVVGIIALSLSLSAQAVTLEEVLVAAEAQNLERRISLEQRERAASEFRQAWTRFLPSLSAQATSPLRAFR